MKIRKVHYKLSQRLQVNCRLTRSETAGNTRRQYTVDNKDKIRKALT